MINDLTVSRITADCKLTMDYFLYICVGLFIFPLDKNLFFFFHEGRIKLLGNDWMIFISNMK